MSVAQVAPDRNFHPFFPRDSFHLRFCLWLVCTPVKPVLVLFLESPSSQAISQAHLENCALLRQRQSRKERREGHSLKFFEIHETTSVTLPLGATAFQFHLRKSAFPFPGTKNPSRGVPSPTCGPLRPERVVQAYVQTVDASIYRTPWWVVSSSGGGPSSGTFFDFAPPSSRGSSGKFSELRLVGILCRRPRSHFLMHCSTPAPCSLNRASVKKQRT